LWGSTDPKGIGLETIFPQGLGAADRKALRAIVERHHTCTVSPRTRFTREGLGRESFHHARISHVLGFKLHASREMSMSSLIECEDVWKIYRVGDVEVQALRGLSLTIEQGEFVAIIGSSGSGKSTLMNILGCLDQPTKGHYRLNGIEVGHLKHDHLAGIRNQQIGFVFQSFNLIPRTSALENAQLPLFYRGLSLKEQRAQAAGALGRVGLQGREHHYPTQLSGGQQQRVAIARALVTSPSLLLADEPTGNLDTQSSQEIMKILETLNRDEGITIILVTHELDVAAYAAREIVIKDGQVLNDRVTKARPTSSPVEA
jgi:putative ABC transport system ATP-binding protein